MNVARYFVAIAVLLIPLTASAEPADGASMSVEKVQKKNLFLSSKMSDYGRLLYDQETNAWYSVAPDTSKEFPPDSDDPAQFMKAQPVDLQPSAIGKHKVPANCASSGSPMAGNTYLECVVLTDQDYAMRIIIQSDVEVEEGRIKELLSRFDLPKSVRAISAKRNNKWRKF